MKFLSKPIVTASMSAIQQAHLTRLERLYQGIQPEMIIALDGTFYGCSHGLSGTNAIDMLAAPNQWLADVLGDMNRQAERLADEVTFRPPVIELDALGVHFIDALFGAKTRFHGDQVWAEELEIELEELQCPDLACSAVLQKTLRLAECAVEAVRQAAGDGQIFIATPVLSCAINVAINLFGERLLMALHTRQEAARRVLAIINDTILQAANAIASAIPAGLRRNSVAENRLAPPGVGQFDGCATQLVSRRDYLEFFAPLDADLIRLFPGGALMHLCGAHTQHVPTWASMPGLRAVQLNDRAVEDLQRYYTTLPAGVIFYLCPSQTMPVERIIELTGGKNVILQTTLQQPLRVRDY
jgi:hypothetical protein